MPFDNLLRQNRVILYRLRLNYGLPIKYIIPETATHNVETGAISRTFRQINIRRAIVLPTTQIRDFVYDLAYIAASKNFTAGGYFEKGNRTIILDARDLPNDVEPNLNHHIEFDDQRWEIAKITRAEDRRGYIFTVSATDAGDLVGT